MKHIALSVVMIISLAISIGAQGRGFSRTLSGNQVIYGDIKVDDSQASNATPLSLDLSLYLEAGTLISRQTVPSNGRYRFINLSSGRYYIIVELENRQITRIDVDLTSPLLGDVRRDIEFQWSNTSGAAKAGVVSAADGYDRPAKNVPIFNTATNAVKNKRYDQATSLLRQAVETDPGDFPAWFELGTVYFIQKNYDDAEKAYLQAISKKADYALALISLGRLRIAQKNFEGAIEVLMRAIKVEPPSAQANYFLGEAYLQIKKGSLAVGYLNEAIKLDPVGMADAHLRLATLYNAVGMKDKAAIEYEEFLKKMPNHPDKKKLQEYITANKKP